MANIDPNKLNDELKPLLDVAENGEVERALKLAFYHGLRIGQAEPDNDANWREALNHILGLCFEDTWGPEKTSRCIHNHIKNVYQDGKKQGISDVLNAAKKFEGD